MSCSQQWLTMSTKQNNKAHETIIADRRVLSHTVFALLINLLLLLLLTQTDEYLSINLSKKVDKQPVRPLEDNKILLTGKDPTSSL